MHALKKFTNIKLLKFSVQKLHILLKIPINYRTGYFSIFLRNLMLNSGAFIQFVVQPESFVPSLLINLPNRIVLCPRRINPMGCSL